MTNEDLIFDLNSDLGEGFGRWSMGDDAALLKIVTSANVACGFHAGDPQTMRFVCQQAVSEGVTIGAHVGYRDLAGFGRRHIDIDPEELIDEIIYQIGALDAFARMAGDRVRYVKPHGALYNTVSTDIDQASAVADAVCRYDPSLLIVGLPGSQLLRMTQEGGLTGIAEAFADRAYTPEGQLVQRYLPGAVIHDLDTIVQRCVRLARTGTIEAFDGTIISVPAQSLCVHGDTPHAVSIAQQAEQALVEAGVQLRSFAGGQL